MGDSLDNASIEPNTTDEHSTSIVESSVFTQFLSKAVKLLLQEEGEDEIDNALAACFEEKNHLECVRKFLSDRSFLLKFKNILARTTFYCSVFITVSFKIIRKNTTFKLYFSSNG